MQALSKKLAEMAPEYDAIINVAAMPRSTPIQASLMDGFELFEEYERIKRHKMLSSMLTCHLAATHLSPDGYILFNSQLASLDESKVAKHIPKPAILDFVANATIAKQGSDLGENRTDEQVVWLNAVTNVLMSEQMITDKQRKNPKELKRHETRLKGCANLLKYWATGDGRPENGSYVGFNTSYLKSGKVVLPKYF